MPKKKDQKTTDTQQDTTALIDPLEKEKMAVSALDKFCSLSHHVGFGNLHRYLRDGVSYMQELQAYDTGLDLRHFAHEEGRSFALDGLDIGKKKREQAIEFQRWLEKFITMIEGQFTEFKDFLCTRIDDIKTKVEEEIKLLDDAVKETRHLKGGTTTIRAVQERKERLKTFVKRLDMHKENITEAKAPEELIEVETVLEQEIEIYETKKSLPREYAEKASVGIAVLFAGLFTALSEFECEAPRPIPPKEPAHEPEFDPLAEYDMRVPASNEEEEPEEPSLEVV